MQTFLIFAIVLGLCFLGLGVKIFFSKEKKFPETEIGHNRAMRKRGIMCTRQEEILRWKKERGLSAGDPQSCEVCGLSDGCKEKSSSRQ